MIPRLSVPKRLKCPQCGEPWDGEDGIVYMEQVPVERRIAGYDDDGTLLIEGEAEVDYESGDRPRLQCKNYKCLYEWRFTRKIDFR